MITSQPCALLSRAIWLSPSRRWKDIEDKGSPLLKSGPWNQPKIWFGHNFWLEGPLDLNTTRLNCILQDLFRGTPLDHIWRSQISILGIFGHIWHKHCVISLEFLCTHDISTGHTGEAKNAFECENCGKKYKSQLAEICEEFTSGVQVEHNLIPHCMQYKIRRIWMSWSNKGFQVLKKLMYMYIPPYIRKRNTLKIVSCFMFKAIWCLWLSISKRYSNLQTRLIYETKDISFPTLLENLWQTKSLPPKKIITIKDDDI